MGKKKFLLALCVALLIKVILFSDWFIYPVKLVTAFSTNFKGTILVAKDNRIIYQLSTEPQLNSQYLCGSIAKQVTAVLIMKEAENGHIDIFAPANNYLTNERKIDKRISVYHLLTHTSGIQKNNKLSFISGTKYSYSNYGYVILRYVLEKITGQNYETLATNLFKRLKMNDSFLVDGKTFSEIKTRHPNFLPSFTLYNGRLIDLGNRLTWQSKQQNGKTIFIGQSCGGLISTIHDLNIWNYKLHNGQILSPTYYNQLIKPIIKSDFPKGEYACGLCLQNEEIYHIGYVDGYKSTVSYFPRNKISLVILENITLNDYEKDFKLHNVIRKIIKIFLKLNYHLIC